MMHEAKSSSSCLPLSFKDARNYVPFQGAGKIEIDYARIATIIPAIY